jgi:hypothetical protein
LHTQDVESFYKSVATQATPEGVQALLEAYGKAKEATAAQDAAVAECEAEIARLHKLQISRNAQCTTATNQFRRAEETFFDSLVDVSDEAAVAKLAAEQESKRLAMTAEVGAYQHLVSVRMPKAELAKSAAGVTRQQAIADQAEAFARYCVARKLLILGPLFEVEGGSLVIEGGLSEEAVKDMVHQRGRWADMAQAQREAEDRVANYSVRKQ